MTAHLLRLATIAGLIATALLVSGCDSMRDRSSSSSGSSSGSTKSSTY